MDFDNFGELHHATRIFRRTLRSLVMRHACRQIWCELPVDGISPSYSPT